MDTYDLSIDSKLKRNLTEAAKAFSKVEYPDAAKVVETLVLNKLGELFELWHDPIKRGERTVKSVLVEPDDPKYDFVTLLEDRDIKSIGPRLDGALGDWLTGRRRNARVLELVKECLTKHNLLRAIEDIGVRVVYSPGLNDTGVIMFVRVENSSEQF